MTEHQKMIGKTSQTRSPRGTKHTGANTKAKLLGIIEGCRNLGVSKIKTPDFEVEFFLERSQEVGDFVAADEIKNPSPIDKDMLDEIRMSQLMIDDPFGFEREVLQAEQRRVIDEAVQN